jgi:hypothetical protein
VSTSFPPGDVLLAAVDQARAAAVDTAGDPELVGEHLGAVHESTGGPELGEVVTHTFATRQPGYVGWHWGVTLAHVPGEDAVSVDEVVLLPGDQALLAPAWVPWHERLRPGDLSVGDVLPSTEDDPRLVPSYAVEDDCRPRDAATRSAAGPRATSAPGRPWRATLRGTAAPAASGCRWPAPCVSGWAPAATPTPRPTGAW